MADTAIDFNPAAIQTLRAAAKRSAEYTDIVCAIGARLRAIRVLAGWSQERLGSAIGVSFQQLQKYETGANRISAAQLVRVGKVLGCKPVQLLPPTSPEAEGSRDPLSEIAGVIGGLGSDGRAILFALSDLPPSAL